ncbi:MAG: alanine racemase [Chloroflexi bacterium]|uniref:Multifunctional fusion protein n=1 Tax=Candidatus Thermofonsia Clade 3 bacterium TaxID=2364212 RepID=A0A2M8QG74_9CHLR|nr:alanine racemase [Candidatus Roseilinea sp. NK_OTU-006]PJF48806.1 MAG: alanine racemase [Candidatus Thermofonsia Clade 3 bacterium]RMG64824.1 MAG: alanine racemase [Chloroflexota bacterium]
MIRLLDLIEATGGRLLGDAPGARAFAGFCFDSRRARPGELFVALRTERGDGHDFVADAIRKGAGGALVEAGRLVAREPFAPDDAPPLIVVPDTYEALTRYARHIIRRRNLPVIAITGSVGKSSTRAAIAAVLGRRFRVFQNPANFNGRLGVPIALGALEAEHEIIVLEMGADRLGEIRELCEIAAPRVGVVTNVSEAHLAYFGALDETAREKRALVEALPTDGLAILNCEDPRVWAMRDFTRAQVVAVGASLCQAAPPHLHPLSCAIAHAMARHYGIPEREAGEALSRLPALPGRKSVLRGVNGAILVDDSFNASPASMRDAVAWASGDLPARVGAHPRGCRFLVFGDMDHLGEHSARLHREIGALVAQRADGRIRLITLGEQAYHVAEGAREAGMDPASVVVTYLARDAVAYIRDHARAGDLVLVKGDVSARMERIVAELLADRADLARLPRQEPGWESVRVAMPSRPTWLEVDLDAIAHNARAVKAVVGEDVALMAVLKADGYGHGAVKVARTALNNGASACAVASLNEAAALRNAGIDAPILILGFTPPWHAREALLRDVALTVYDLDVARAYARAAQELNRTARLHVKVDTGMGRLGVLPDAAPDFIRAVAALPGVCVEGIFTHFSCADSDPDYTRLQIARFREVLDALGDALPTLRYVHAANSAGALAYPEARFNLVRVGLALYGLNPFSPAPLRPAGLALRPALTWKTTIAQVKRLPPGSPVSYGKQFICQRETTIAVIPVGYADGFRRAPSTFGEVLVRGRRAPIVGAVCMDQAMIDVSHIPGVRLGDEVVLIGRQGDQRITAEDVAARLGTISYEVISAILARVPRVS